MPDMTSASLRDYYTALEAGPEMNRQVAERVMGWRYAGFCRRGPVFYTTNEDDPLKTRELSVDFDPSRDLSSAWEVVNVLNKSGFTVEMFSQPTVPEGKPCMCQAWRDCEGTFDHESAGANRMDLAICRAAMLTTL